MKKRLFKISFFNNKKGISPLIATVLLIAFAVALGAVVMNWGRSYVEETARQSGITSDTKVTCAQQVRLEIALDSSRRPMICYDENDRNIRLTVINRGGVDLQGFLFNVLGEDGIFDQDFDEVLERSRLKRFTLDYDVGEFGDIEFVQIVPKVRVSGSATPAECSDSDLRIDEIFPCP